MMKFKILSLLLILAVTSSTCVFSIDNSSNITTNSIDTHKNMKNNTSNLNGQMNTIYVNPNGNDTNDGFTPDKPKKTIANAVNVTRNKGTIILEEGLYKEDENNSIIVDKSITFQGQNATIDCEYPSFSISNTAVFNGITFQNCHKSVFFNHFTNLKINNCIFNNNDIDDNIIHNLKGEIEITNCKFNSNTGKSGIFYNELGKAQVINCTFNNNIVNRGTIYSVGTLTVKDCNFTGNIAENNSTISIDGNNTLTGSTFSANSACDGGAISSSGHLTIKGCKFISNNASDNGGAILIKWGSSTIIGSMFSANSAYNGGAIQNQYEEDSDRVAKCSINNCTFTDNKGCAGGSINNKGQFKVNETIITHNKAFTGGFMDNWGTCTITYSAITDNEASGGGAVSNIGTINMHNNSIIENVAECGSAILNEKGHSVDAKHNFWGLKPKKYTENDSDDYLKSQMYGDVDYSFCLESPVNVKSFVAFFKSYEQKPLNEKLDVNNGRTGKNLNKSIIKLIKGNMKRSILNP